MNDSVMIPLVKTFPTAPSCRNDRVYAPLASASFQDWFEAELRGLTREVVRVIGPDLVALILGGGYGRGEGGVRQVDGQERPHNDLDLFLVVRRPVDVSGLDGVKHRFEKRLGIDVDFSHPLTVPEIRRWDPRLMWVDLLGGHRVLHGDPRILLQNAPRFDAGALPPHEAARLMLNRGAGLLWAMRVQGGFEEAPDPDFVRRNAQKALLGMGDAVLIQEGRHDLKGVARIEVLDRLLARDLPHVRTSLVAAYHEATEFKLRPDSVSPALPSIERLGEIARLWLEVFVNLENRRTGEDWADDRQYTRWTGCREPGENGLARWPRNLARGLRRGVITVTYPREEVYRRLPGLLRGPGSAIMRWGLESRDLLEVWRTCD